MTLFKQLISGEFVSAFIIPTITSQEINHFNCVKRDEHIVSLFKVELMKAIWNNHLIKDEYPEKQTMTNRQ